MPKAHTKPAYTQKNPKNQKPIYLCNIESEMFLFFLSICRFGDFSLSTPWFFWYMQVLWTWSPSNLHILKENKHFDTEKPQNLHILKKKQHFDAKSAQNLHILKKIKSFDSEKSPNLQILKKIKKIKNQFIYASQSHIESEIFDFFDFFEYMQVLCTFGIKMLIFFEYMQVWWTSSPSNLHIHKKTNILIGNSSEPAYTQKNQKNQKPIHLCQSVPHRVWDFDFFDFFEYMQVWWLFTIKTFDFFEYMQVLCTFGIKMLIFFEYMQVWCALVKIMHFFASHAGFGEV